MREAPVINVTRQLTDEGRVVITVGFGSCPLRCKNCDSPMCFERRRWRLYTTKALYELIIPDEQLMLEGKGEVVFTAGEPCMRAKFIIDLYEMSEHKWPFVVCSSLNVPSERVELLAPVVARWEVDIKDMNPRIYQSYTGKDNLHVIENLRMLAAAGYAERVKVKVPSLQGFNTADDRERSLEQLRVLGFEQFI